MDVDIGEEWVEDDDVSLNLKAKIMSLKVCRNRSLAHASSDTALAISTPVLKMLSTLLDHNGSFTDDAAEEYVPFTTLSTGFNHHFILLQSESDVSYATTSCRVLAPPVDD
jgi:hypothetical protein